MRRKTLSGGSLTDKTDGYRLSKFTCPMSAPHESLHVAQCDPKTSRPPIRKRTKKIPNCILGCTNFSPQRGHLHWAHCRRGTAKTIVARPMPTKRTLSLRDSGRLFSLSSNISGGFTDNK